jgi:hypothetical protein
MIPTSQKSRARVAAEVYARDNAHLMDQVECVAVTRDHKSSQMLAAAGRRAELSIIGRTYPRHPLALDPQNTHVLHGVRNAAGNGKRLRALIDLAIATGTRITFRRRSHETDVVAVDCDVTCTLPCSRTPEALDAAARWMRIEHAEAVGRLMRRAHGSGIDFRIAYPDDPTACIQAVERSFAEVAAWVRATIAAPLHVVPEGETPAETLRQLLDGIPAKRLTKAQAGRLNRARAIVGRMAEAA